jgi:hypothetical protein
MKTWPLLIILALGGCAHGEKQALAVLAVSADEVAHVYAEAKRRRLVYCEAVAQDAEEGRKCMGPFHGDRGTDLLETIVEAQDAMTKGVEALSELKEITKHETSR